MKLFDSSERFERKIKVVEWFKEILPENDIENYLITLTNTVKEVNSWAEVGDEGWFELFE